MSELRRAGLLVKASTHSKSSSIGQCPICGSNLKIIKGWSSSYLCCDSYPACHYLEEKR